MADVQRFLRPVSPERYRIDQTGTNPISFGDLLSWDTVNRFLIRLAGGAGLKFVGVAMGRIPIASNIDNVTTILETDVNVFDRGIFFFKTTAAQSYEHGDPVKIGADAQTILLATPVTDADEIIGFIWKPTDSAATTGAAGVSVQVAVMRRFPNFGIGTAGASAVVPAMLG